MMPQRQLQHQSLWLYITLLALALAAQAVWAAGPLKLFSSVQQGSGAALASADMPAGTLLPPSDLVSRGSTMMTEVAAQGLKQGPEAIELTLPGFDLPFLTKRRSDMPVTLKALAAAVEAPERPSGGFAPADVGDLNWDIGTVTDPYQWVGEVEGYEGAESVVALVVGEQDDSMHGVIRFVDQKGKVKLYHINPTLIRNSSGKVKKHPRLHNVYPAIEPRKLHKMSKPKRDPKTVVSTVVDQPNISPPAAFAGIDLNTPTLLGPSFELAGGVSGGSSLAGVNQAVPMEMPGRQGGSGNKRRQLLQMGLGGLPVQDLLVVYTAAAAREAGGDQALTNQARLSVAMANKAYADSGIGLQLNLLEMRKVNYTETRDPLGDLTDGLGGLAIAHTWREQLGADMVSLFNNNNDVCGIAWMAVGQYPEWAFSAVMRGCWSSFTLAHELGHNQGCGHNVQDGRDAWLAGPYAFGWKVCSRGGSGPQFKSIMSYDCPSGSTPRVGLFSSPNLQYQGATIGHPTDGDCARAIRQTAVSVSNFKRRAGYNAPTAVDDFFPGYLDMETSFAVLLNDFDKDGNALTVTSIPREPTNGMAVISADGKKIVYTPFGMGSGFDYLTYEITDTTGLTAQAKVTITVLRNHAPILSPDVITVYGETPVTFNLADLLQNDNDADPGDKLSKPALGTTGMQGTLSVVQGLTFRYTPKRGWMGDDVVPYSVTDSPAGTTSQSSLTFKVVADPCVNHLCAPFSGAGNCSQSAEACICAPGSGLVPMKVPAPDGNGKVLACRYALVQPVGVFSLTESNEAARSSRVVFSFKVSTNGVCPWGDRGKVVKSPQGVQMVSTTCPPASAGLAAVDQLPAAPRRGSPANSERCEQGVVTYVLSTPRQAGCYNMTVNLTDKTMVRTVLKVA